jgi:hypothetical protein
MLKYFVTLPFHTQLLTYAAVISTFIGTVAAVFGIGG